MIWLKRHGQCVFQNERLQTSQTGCCTVFSFLGPASCSQLRPLLMQRYILSQKGSCQCDSQVSTNSSKLEDLPSWVSFWLLSLKAVILEWLFMWFALFPFHNCKIQELQIHWGLFLDFLHNSWPGVPWTGTGNTGKPLKPITWRQPLLSTSLTTPQTASQSHQCLTISGTRSPRKVFQNKK